MYPIYEIIFQYLVNFLVYLIKYLFYSFLFIHTIPSIQSKKSAHLFPLWNNLNDMI